MRPLLFAVSLCLIACAGIPLPKEKLTDAPGGLLFNGYGTAKVECFKCHNGDAKGSMRGPGLDGLSDHSDEQLTETIRDGSGMMPSHKELSAAEITQIVAWLRTPAPAPAPAPAAPAPATPEAAVAPETAAPETAAPATP